MKASPPPSTRPGAAGPRFSRALTRAVAFAAAVPLALAGCRDHPAASPGSSPGAALPPAQVEVVTVQRATRPALEEVVGTVQSRVRATVEAKVSGRIRSLPVRLGQVVQAGDLLAELDAREVQARLEQAVATRDQAARDIERLRRLLQEKVISASEFDEMQARFRVAAAAVTEAETMLSHTRVTAPFNGVVTRKRAEVGDLASPGKALVDLEDPRQLRLEASVPETAIDLLKPGLPLAIRMTGRTNDVAATITEIAPSADPASRTFLIQADLPEAAGLRPGQFGRALVPIGQTSSIRLPDSALFMRGQLELVMVATNGRAALRLVRSGRRDGGSIEIVAGLDAGETVVRSGGNRLSEGQALVTGPR